MSNHSVMKGETVLLCMEGIDESVLKDRSFILCALFRAAQQAGCEIVGRSDKKFPDGSYSMNLVLAESHLYIHTYPSQGYACVDITACGESQPWKIVGVLTELFSCEKYGYHRVQRPLKMDKYREDKS